MVDKPHDKEVGAKVVCRAPGAPSPGSQVYQVNPSLYNLCPAGPGAGVGIKRLEGPKPGLAAVGVQ
jgi:hypothetical protein